MVYNSIIFRPGIASSLLDGYVETWAEVENFITNTTGYLTVVVDDLLSSAVVPSMTNFDCENRVTFVSRAEGLSNPYIGLVATLIIEDGALIKNIEGISKGLNIDATPTAQIPLIFDNGAAFIVSGGSNIIGHGGRTTPLVDVQISMFRICCKDDSYFSTAPGTVPAINIGDGYHLILEMSNMTEFYGYIDANWVGGSDVSYFTFKCDGTVKYYPQTFYYGAAIEERTEIISGIVTNRTISSNYSIDTFGQDHVLLVDTSSAITITMPPLAISGRIFLIKDITGQANSNNITLARSGSEKIEGSAANKILDINFGKWTFMCDGTDWFLIG